MKIIFSLLLLIACQPIFAQGSSKASVFHRLLIYNADNDFMLVKIKDTDTWVTPGFYQDSTQFVKKGLHDIAATYGLTVTDPEVKGMFSMRRERDGKQEMLVRNIYHANYVSGEEHFPENQSFEIGEIKWLPMEEARKVISFESMTMFIQRTDDYPNEVSGGSIHASRQDGAWKYETIEEFYPIFKAKN
ncbi:MAG: hypothetical protein AB8F78_09290 [Saprospiraceae bacterium]